MPPTNGRAPRVLVTGTGGPSGISFMQALRGEPVEFHSADIDPYAAGLYLVEASRRLIVPRGDDPAFADALLEACGRRGIDALVPTVDAELLPLAERREEFGAAGTAMLLAPAAALRTCLDKWELMRAVAGEVEVPRTELLDADLDPSGWSFPVIVKPRRGSGSRGVMKIEGAGELDALSGGGELLVQEHLPGAEYSVDVLATEAGEVRAAVPRARLKIDSGIAITGRTLHHQGLQAAAAAACELVGLTGVANAQFKQDGSGTPRLIEINPRFPGTMPLTVASGVNMPRLALAEQLGEPMPAGPLEFREVAMTRHLEGTVVDAAELEALEAEASAAGETIIP